MSQHYTVATSAGGNREVKSKGAQKVPMRKGFRHRRKSIPIALEVQQLRRTLSIVISTGECYLVSVPSCYSGRRGQQRALRHLGHSAIAALRPNNTYIIYIYDNS